MRKTVHLSSSLLRATTLEGSKSTMSPAEEVGPGTETEAEERLKKELAAQLAFHLNLLEAAMTWCDNEGIEELRHLHEADMESEFVDETQWATEALSPVRRQTGAQATEKELAWKAKSFDDF